MVLVVKNLLTIAGGVLIPGSGRCSGEGHDHPLQYSCLEHLMDRGAWWATVHRITKSQIQLKRLSMHSMTLEVPLKSYSQPCGIRWLMRKYCRRRQWHPTPVLLPGKSHGWRSLVGCSPWGR